MTFPIDKTKATQAVARIIERSGGQAEYLRIVKLIYLADRESIAQRGIPISGGHYYSMRRGPTIGEVMDLVCYRDDENWKQTVSHRHGNLLKLQSEPDFDSLSESELAILDGIVEQHKNTSTEDLVEWCHQNCPEYRKVGYHERRDITVEEILEAVGKPAKIARVVREANALKELDALLA